MTASSSFVQQISKLAFSPTLAEEALREVVTDTLMECVKIGNSGNFHSSICHKFIHSLHLSQSARDIMTTSAVDRVCNGPSLLWTGSAAIKQPLKLH